MACFLVFGPKALLPFFFSTFTINPATSHHLYSYYSSPIHYHLLPKSLQLSRNLSSCFCHCSSSLFLLFLKILVRSHYSFAHKPSKGPHSIRVKVQVLTMALHDISSPIPQIHLECSCLEAFACALIFCLNYFSP